MKLPMIIRTIAAQKDFKKDTEREWKKSFRAEHRKALKEETEKEQQARSERDAKIKSARTTAAADLAKVKEHNVRRRTRIRSKAKRDSGNLVCCQC